MKRPKAIKVRKGMAKGCTRNEKVKVSKLGINGIINRPRVSIRERGHQTSRKKKKKREGEWIKDVGGGYKVRIRE